METTATAYIRSNTGVVHEGVIQSRFQGIANCAWGGNYRRIYGSPISAPRASDQLCGRCFPEAGK